MTLPTPRSTDNSKIKRRRRPKPAPFGPDPFTQHYASRLDGVYDCVDRLTINAYFPYAQSPGGFRIWRRDLYRLDDMLDNTHLMRMAGRFSRRLRGWGNKHGVPVIYCQSGEREHTIGEEHLPNDPTRIGIFCILVGRAPAPIWVVQRYGNNGINLRRKEPYPFVNHYYFHFWVADWGYLIVRMCGHPPFNAMVILNGDEYVSNQATRNPLCQRGQLLHRLGQCCGPEPGRRHLMPTRRDRAPGEGPAVLAFPVPLSGPGCGRTDEDPLPVRVLDLSG